MKLQDFKQQLLKDKKIREEFEKFDLAFEISKKLIEARIIKNLTQKELANLIGTKQSSIARAESGSSLPSISFLEKIAKALDTKLVVSFELVESTKTEFFTNQYIPSIDLESLPYEPILEVSQKEKSSLLQQKINYYQGAT